jgi:hypothetical protein
VADERRREREVVAVPLARQQVGDDRAPDELVPEVDRIVGEGENPMLDRFREAGREVCVDRAVAAAGQRCGARRGPMIGRPLVGRGDVGQLGHRERPRRRSKEPEHPPALRGAEPEPGDHEVLEADRQRRARELAAGGQHLLRDERDPAAPLGDEDEGRAGGPLALDRLDQVGQLVAVERLERPLGGRRPR